MMFKTFLENFNKLPLSNKSMIYLMWINLIGDIISSIFINIYIFNLFSINEVIIYNIIHFSFCLIGFSGIGILMSYYRKNIKNLYYIGYGFFILSFLILFILKGELIGIYLFGILFGLGAGSFRNAVHTQELKNIKNKNREFYSSSISVGGNVLNIITPLATALIFIIGKFANIDGYTILFSILPFIYLISLFFIKNIESYVPEKIKNHDVKNFFNMKKYKYGHLYFFIGGIMQSLVAVIIPVLSIYFLKDEINISIFQTILTLLSTTIVIHLSHTRQDENRLKYFFIVSILIVLNFLFLGLFSGLISFLIFSLINLFLTPIFRVSEHVYDLSLMDNIKIQDSDFYPAMIFREVFLWIGRVFILLVILIFIYIGKNNIENTLKIGIFLTAISYLFMFICIYFWEKHEKNIL